jgi:hypothetical protein
VQYESHATPANQPTSYIATTNATVTRAVEAISATVPDMLATGCVRGDITNGAGTSNSTSWFGNGTLRLMRNLGLTSMSVNDGTNTVTHNGADISGRTVDALTKWGASTMTARYDAAETSGTFDNNMGTTTTLYVGSTSTTEPAIGCMKAIRVHTTKTGCD